MALRLLFTGHTMFEFIKVMFCVCSQSSIRNSVEAAKVMSAVFKTCLLQGLTLYAFNGMCSSESSVNQPKTLKHFIITDHNSNVQFGLARHGYDEPFAKKAQSKTSGGRDTQV
eukprot:TRINITY_DN384_c1_g1_i16.p2 TRINITY_DN384_c1_g1~~TRINITY_DN384_c1_g1_i16.p2  ORF type:complete len:113 (+),score=2.02 TRINITY_DN384_c1_g1_i16:266-604(+)